MHNAELGLSHGDEGKIDVVHVKRNILMIGQRGLYFRHVRMRAKDGTLLGASFCVRVGIPGTTVVEERSFRLVPDATQHLRLRAELIEPGT